MTRTEITLDQINDLPRGIERKSYVALGDYPFVGKVIADVEANDHGTGYARTERTGVLLRFRPLTGKVRRDGMVRVVCTFGVDSGDLAGTLIFDEENPVLNEFGDLVGTTCRGFISSDLLK